MNTASRQASAFAKGRRRKKLWQRIVAGLSCATVFCTTYALILPAITMESGFYCGYSEHTHSEDCYTRSLICQLDEDSTHVHSEECFESVPTPVCGEEAVEPHTHSDLCYTQEIALTCGREASEGHTHSGSCYETTRDLICETEESQEHTHGDSCYQVSETLVCQLPEGEGHSHDDSCYTPTGDKILSCGKEETEGHVHTDSCMEPQNVLTCPLEEGAVHEHTDECYEDVLFCDMEEHTHTLSCRCNPDAVESPRMWEATLPGNLSGVWADDLLAVAESQLGYAEREDNFTVSEDGNSITGYYTRYGDWYGIPYGAWCAMFVSFCLNYAEIPQEAFPREASVRRWVDKVSGEAEGYRGFDLFRDPGHYDPRPGDLVFFDTDGDSRPCHVGIVTEFIPAAQGSPAVLKTIEGNYGDKVQRVTRTLSGAGGEDTLTVFGYAALPEKPLEEPVETVPATEAAEATEATEVTETTEATEATGTTETTEPSETAPRETEGSDTENQDNSLICGKEPHTHTDACYGPEDENGEKPLLCGLEEHIHGEGCFAASGEEPEAPQLTCGMEEHTHSDACYGPEDEKGEKPLLCGMEEHTHGEGCRRQPTEEEPGTPQLICGTEEHIHTELCCTPDPNGTDFLMTCGKEAHLHTEGCYALPEREYRYEDETILVCVVLPADSLVPEDAQLRVTPITREESRYALLEQQAKGAVDGELRQLVLYDLSFYTGEEEYLPVEDSALVTISFKQEVLSPSAEQVTVLHYSQEDAAPLALSEVEIQRDENEALSGLTFQTEGFSVYGVASSVQPVPAVYSAPPTAIDLYTGQDYTAEIYTANPAISPEGIVSGVTTSEAQILKIGTDANYAGSRVDPSEALYTFTGDNTNGFMVSHGSIYLSFAAPGCPNGSSAGSITFQNSETLAEITEPGEFAIRSDAGKYLFFHRNATTPGMMFSFDQRDAFNHESCRFLLYRPAAEGESSDAIPGYVRVESLDGIQPGSQYLIVAEAQDGVNYLLYPSTSSNRYAHAAKIVPYSLTLTAKAAGTATVHTGISDLTVNVTDQISVEATRQTTVQLPAEATVTVTDPSIAEITCDKSGLITIQGINKGSTQATVTVNGENYTWNITVEPRSSFQITYGEQTLTFHLQDKNGNPIEVHAADFTAEAATKYVFVEEGSSISPEENPHIIYLPEISGYQHAVVKYQDHPVCSVATPGYEEDGITADPDHFRFFGTEPPTEDGIYTVTQAEDDAYVSYEEGPITTTVTPTGTVINLFDYWVTGENEGQASHKDGNKEKGINAGHALKFNDDSDEASGTLNKWTGDKAGVLQGIVADRLGPDGYPRLSGAVQPSGGASEESLAYLFDPNYTGASSAYRRTYSRVGDLLQVDSDGYYYYDSHLNYAEYDQEINRFHLYSDWAVSFHNELVNQGEFFPFNPYSTVNRATDASNKALNHFFGLTMTTRFIQQNDGYTDLNKRTKTTFEFSGDDDVWIFVDGVLVADLGGIHDAASVTINFADGTVTISQVYRKKPDVTKKFSEIFDSQSLDANRKTLQNGTYHTLKFYYLERGGYASNLKLKYNLVTYPVSGITKVDQVGDPVRGAEFSLYRADANYNKLYGTPLYTGVTAENGEFIFMNGEEPISLHDLKKESEYFVLDETKVPTGYRSTGVDIHLRIKESGTANPDGSYSYVMVCDNTQESGAWADPSLQVAAPQQLMLANRKDPTTFYDPGSSTTNGTLFGVVLKYIGPEGEAKTSAELAKEANWAPVYGSAERGYTILPTTGGFIDAAIRAAKQSRGYENFFRPASSGAMQATMSDLPGSIESYYFISGLANPKNIRYNVGYYWSSASSISEVNASNTYRVQVYHEDNHYRFYRTFGTSIKVPNMINRIAVQKLGENSTPLNGATFAMYQVEEEANAAKDAFDPYYFIAQDEVHADVPVYLETDVSVQYAGSAMLVNDKTKTGRYTVDPATGIVTVTIEGKTYTIRPIQVETSVSASENNYKEDGIAEFEKMSTGKYIIRELTAPEGYTVNYHTAMVLVTDNAVYANAGTEDDGVTVSRGPGYLAANLHNFASFGHIENTLTWVYTQLKVSPVSTRFSDVNSKGYEGWSWVTRRSDGTIGEGPVTAYLKYITPEAGDTSLATTARFSYAVDDNPESHAYSKNIALARRLYTRVGWSYLEIYQNYDYGIKAKSPHAEYEDWRYVLGSDHVRDDLSNVFSRSVYVHFTDKKRTGDLEISKTVENAPANDDSSFDFQVDLYNGTQEVTVGEKTYTIPAPLGGSFSYTVKNADGTSGSPGTVSGGGTITLRDGQTALIAGLPYGTSYAVTERQEYRLALYEIKTSGDRQLVNPLTGDCQYTLYNVFRGEAADGTSTDVRQSAGSQTFPGGIATFSLCANQAVEITQGGKVLCEIVSGADGSVRIESMADGITATLTAEHRYATSARIEAETESTQSFQIGQTKTVSGEELYWEHTTRVRFTNTCLPDQSLLKVKEDDPTVLLRGAEFTLSQTVNGTEYYYTADQGWMIAKGEDAPLPLLISGNDGKISLHLPDGMYTLTETKAPAGYQKLTAPIEITVKDGRITKAQMGDTDLAAGGSNSVPVIPNTLSHELPMTGGMGTNLFYLLGGILVIFAGVLLAARRRMYAE